jgi:hypothetical protein
VLFQSVHHIIGNAVALFFGEFFAKPPNKFSRAPQCERDGEAQQIPTGPHPSSEQTGNIIVNSAPRQCRVVARLPHTSAGNGWLDKDRPVEITSFGRPTLRGASVAFPLGRGSTAFSGTGTGPNEAHRNAANAAERPALGAANEISAADFQKHRQRDEMKHWEMRRVNTRRRRE